MRRTLDPKLDVVFKLLFADERNKSLLVALLSAVLKPACPITELTLLNPEIERTTLLEKGAVLDVRVKLENGTLPSCRTVLPLGILPCYAGRSFLLRITTRPWSN